MVWYHIYRLPKICMREELFLNYPHISWKNRHTFPHQIPTRSWRCGGLCRCRLPVLSQTLTPKYPPWRSFRDIRYIRPSVLHSTYDNSHQTKGTCREKHHAIHPREKVEEDVVTLKMAQFSLSLLDRQRFLTIV